LKLCRLTRSEPPGGSAGFTLIEVVVTLAVIAAILASVGSLVSVAVRGTRALDDHLVLVETARAIEVGLPDRSSLRVGTLSGERSGQRWRVDIRPLRVEETRVPSPWVPLSATITVQSPGGTTFQVTTVRLGRRPPG
jgi:general secretion pathway protein I